MELLCYVSISIILLIHAPSSVCCLPLSTHSGRATPSSSHNLDPLHPNETRHDFCCHCTTASTSTYQPPTTSSLTKSMYQRLLLLLLINSTINRIVDVGVGEDGIHPQRSGNYPGEVSQTGGGAEARE